MKQTWRVGTWNVHAWGDAAGRVRISELIDVVAALSLDVLIVNEALSRGGPLLRLADVTGLTSVVFGAAAWGGNAILSRAPITSHRVVPLAVRGAEQRTALIATVADGPTVMALHLDDRREDVRLAQLDLALAAFDEAGGSGVVGGDLNAVDVDDLDDDERAAVAAMRAQNGRERLRGDVIARLRSRGVDAVRAAAHVDAGVLPPELRVSCWAGTRVDHLWLCGRAAGEFAAEDAVVVDTDVSDHRPVAVTLRRR